MRYQLLFIIGISIFCTECRSMRFPRGNVLKRGEPRHGIYVDENGCPQGTDYVCNQHNSRYNCTCYRPNQIMPLQYPTCDIMFDMKNPRAYVIELRTALPQEPNMINNYDHYLAELISDFCAIPPEFLIILRKRCDSGMMVVQIAFLRATDAPIPEFLGVSELQAIHPDIFTKNDDFMDQEILPILEVSEVDFLSSVVRRPARKQLTKSTEDSSSKPLNQFLYFTFVGLMILVVNLIPICILCQIIRDRRTRASNASKASSPTQSL
ncbi:hypothetical protein M3Y97_00719100 [Aphelenchoides bicaudatus]|nr:hypothetical protein M3Y97_00719100 [Aphelenchoides bicaudatus]